MKILLCLAVLATTGYAYVHSEQIQDMNRDCPEGFFYAGEATVPENSTQMSRDSMWIEGPASPIYSCYKFMKGMKTFAGASMECNNIEGVTAQLVSVESRGEDDILASQLFWERIPQDVRGDLVSAGALTSGIQLSAHNWTWFGADVTVDDSLMVLEQDLSVGDDVKCLVMRWNMSSNHVDLRFEQIPCGQEHVLSLCETHVYTQTWYVWFYSNWIQILMFVAMLLLILSACCLFQALFFRTRVRSGQALPSRGARRCPAQQRARRASLPPTYAATQQPPAYVSSGQQPIPVYAHQDDSFIHESPAERYIRKGREIMAQVTFFKAPQNEKSPLPQ
jgi:hypothetical protein